MAEDDAGVSFALWLCAADDALECSALDEELCVEELAECDSLERADDSEAALLLECIKMGAGFVPRPSPDVAVLMMCAVAKTVKRAIRVRMARMNQRFPAMAKDPDTARSLAFAAACVYLACRASNCASSLE